MKKLNSIKYIYFSIMCFMFSLPVMVYADGLGEDFGDDLTENTCEAVLGTSVVEFIQMVFNYIKILGPILVILFSSIDFTKSILSSDEENMKKTQKKFAVRLLCAVALYFLPLIATLIINLVFGTSGNQVCGLK